MVHRFWRDSSKAAHPLPGHLEDDAELEYVSIAPHAWHRALRPLLKIASKPDSVLRYIGTKANLSHRFYRPWDKFESEHRSRYVETVVVPDGTSAGTKLLHFWEVFDRTVGRVVAEWHNLAGNVAPVLDDPVANPAPFPNWDLDTGVNMPNWERTTLHGLDRLALWSDAV